MMMKTRKEITEPYVAESLRAPRVRKLTGEGENLAGKTSGHDEVNLNLSQRRLTSDKGAPNCSVEFSFLKKKKKNKKIRRKRTISIGTWNIRTLLDMGKLHLLIRELEHQEMNITGLCECRWEGNGHFNCGDHLIIYSGAEKSGQAGVALVLDKEAKQGLISYNAVSERLLVVHLNTKPVKTTFIQCYAPTSSHEEEEIKEFYSQLQSVKD